MKIKLMFLKNTCRAVYFFIAFIATGWSSNHEHIFDDKAAGAPIKAIVKDNHLLPEEAIANTVTSLSENFIDNASPKLVSVISNPAIA